MRGGGPVRRTLEAEADAYIGAVLDRIAEAGEAGLRRAVLGLLEPGNRWNPLTRQLIGQITSHDPEDCSTLDSARYEDDGGDFPGGGWLRRAGGAACGRRSP